MSREGERIESFLLDFMVAIVKRIYSESMAPCDRDAAFYEIPYIVTSGAHPGSR